MHLFCLRRKKKQHAVATSDRDVTSIIINKRGAVTSLSPRQPAHACIIKLDIPYRRLQHLRSRATRSTNLWEGWGREAKTHLAAVLAPGSGLGEPHPDDPKARKRPRSANQDTALAHRGERGGRPFRRRCRISLRDSGTICVCVCRRPGRGWNRFIPSPTSRPLVGRRIAFGVEPQRRCRRDTGSGTSGGSHGARDVAAAAAANSAAAVGLTRSQSPGSWRRRQQRSLRLGWSSRSRHRSNLNRRRRGGRRGVGGVRVEQQRAPRARRRYHATPTGWLYRRRPRRRQCRCPRTAATNRKFCERLPGPCASAGSPTTTAGAVGAATTTVGAATTTAAAESFSNRRRRRPWPRKQDQGG